VTDRPAETIVLGAGIAGTALAGQLARAGFAPVVVVDPSTPAAGATGRAAGIVTEQLWDRWDVDVVRETMAEYARLAARYEPNAYRANGFVRWTTRAEVAPLLESAEARLRGWGVDVRSVAPEELARQLPWVRTDDIVAAGFAPKDGVVMPSRMAELLVDEARALGVEFVFGAPVDDVGFRQGRWTVTSGERTFRAARAVVAAGAWSKKLLARVGAPLPLTPYRTQAALLRPTGGSGGDFPSFHDIDLDVYGRPEDAGRVLVGNGTEAVEADPDRFVPGGDERFLAHVAESFDTRLPGWKDADLLRAWAGVCVATPDRHPVIGPVPGTEGLYAITGFNGFGVMRAPGAARRLAAAMREPARSAELLGPTLPARLRLPPKPFAPKPGFTLESGPDPRW
jgi:sarcosine oxidase subunit beta